MNCATCGGFIGEPGKVYGYAGKWCHCWNPASRPLTAAPTIDPSRVREVLLGLGKPRFYRAGGQWVVRVGMSKYGGATPKAAWHAYLTDAAKQLCAAQVPPRAQHEDWRFYAAQNHQTLAS